MQKNENKRQEYLKLIYSHHEWQSTIKPNLVSISKKVFGYYEIINKFNQFFFYSRTHRHQSQKEETFKYKQLLTQYRNELPEITSQMAKIILKHEKNPPKYPILYSGENKQITFTKEQKLLLMSMMAMNLIPDQEFRFTHRFPRYTDFRNIFSEWTYKTTTVIQYFKEQFLRLKELGQKYGQQKLSLKRHCISQNIQQIIERQKEKKMIELVLSEDNESIQEYFGEVKVDFANKFIGGGALVHGCVQQEIMFSNHPQMFTSVLLCEMMKQNQAIQFIGYKKYFKNYGYGHTVGYDGVETHKYKYDEQNRAAQRIVGIDAIHFPYKKFEDEYSSEIISRQILKAYAGFSKSGEQNSKKIVSGNWGCGAFNGDIQMKYVIQWIAASLAQKQLIYVPFGQRSKLNNEFINKKLSQMKVGDVYRIIIQNQEQLKKQKNIFKLLTSKTQNIF